LPTATASSSEALHTVQQGETLNDIVQRYGISLQELLSANNLEAGARPSPGDTLVIPLEAASAPTPTRRPTATPTPGEPYAAPLLLYPLQHARLAADEPVVLQWTSSGILQEDEWYEISLRYLGQRSGGRPSEIVVYARITSWRVPAEWAPGPDASERRFEWMVQVVRRGELGRSSVPLSLPSEVRGFSW
jgi:hypothetical protein